MELHHTTVVVAHKDADEACQFIKDTTARYPMLAEGGLGTIALGHYDMVSPADAVRMVLDDQSPLDVFEQVECARALLDCRDWQSAVNVLRDDWNLEIECGQLVEAEDA